MKTCWVIYKYINKLDGFHAKKFIGYTYEEIEEVAKEWLKDIKDIEVVDVAETVYEDDEE
jgi:hypothetical protein